MTGHNNKRKQKSPLSSPKKKKKSSGRKSSPTTTTNNISNPISRSSSISSTSRDDNNTTSKLKPIIVFSNYSTTNQAILSANLKIKPHLKIVNNEKNPKVQIFCGNYDDKLVLINLLKANHFKFHSFAEPFTRDKVFVLKKHYYLDLDNMLNLLKQAGVPAIKVSFVWDNMNNPIYLVHFKDVDMNIHILNHQHKAIDNLIVKWEKFDSSKKKIFPCRRCKQWGHSASNCNHDYRCIKCTNNHPPGQCPRTDKSIGKPKCVNCGGDHPANFSKCPNYLAYQQNIRKQHKTKPHQTQMNQIPSHHTQSNVTYSDVVRKNVSNNNLNDNSRFTRLNNLNARFNAIPNIDSLLDSYEEFIDKLSSTNNNKDRLSILLQYTSNFGSLINND
jgi:hypothetical protein